MQWIVNWMYAMNLEEALDGKTLTGYTLMWLRTRSQGILSRFCRNSSSILANMASLVSGHQWGIYSGASSSSEILLRAMISVILTSSRFDAAKKKGESEAATSKSWHHWVSYIGNKTYTYKKETELLKTMIFRFPTRAKGALTEMFLVLMQGKCD